MKKKSNTTEQQCNKQNVIASFSSCPHCGGTSGYYCLERITGVVQDNTTWEGIKENYNMNDSILYKRIHKYYKCQDCHKNIARIPL